MQYEVTYSRNGTIALAYRARDIADGMVASAATRGLRLYARPQADGTCLIVNTPKYENIWAFNRSPRNGNGKRRKARK
jgi:hypothetical protein